MFLLSKWIFVKNLVKFFVANILILLNLKLTFYYILNNIVIFLSNDNSSNETSSMSFCPIFFCPTTLGPISKRRSLVKEILTLTLNPKPKSKPYWTKRRGRSFVDELFRTKSRYRIFVIFIGRHGENYFDPTTNLQYVLLRDEDPIDVFTSPAVYVKIGLQAISIDDFFGENLLSNVAK